jgi:hypothetical protein
MLARNRAFEGDDVGDTLAAIIRGESDWAALPADLPRPLRAFIQGCLEKDRARRIGHISTARFALDAARTRDRRMRSQSRGLVRPCGVASFR